MFPFWCLMRQVVDGAFLWNADEQLIRSYYFLPGAMQTQNTEHGGEQA